MNGDLKDIHGRRVLRDGQGDESGEETINEVTQ